MHNGVVAVSSQRRRSVKMLKLFFANIICKTFRFPVNASPNHQLFVYEYMGEGKLTYVLPRQLLYVNPIALLIRWMGGRMDE